MKGLAASFVVVLLLAFGVAAQTSPPDSPDASPSSSAEDYSGMYSFLKDGEFVQLTVEDGNRVTGFVSRFGEQDSDHGAFLDQFFKEAKLEGKKLSFVTQTVHGVRYEFNGTVERGAGKNVGDEGYRVLRGSLVQFTSEAGKNISAKSQAVLFKEFPEDVGEDSPKPR
jgi:hypothetical protein